jgi:Icc-related predicted phosphoesterase
MKVLIASDGHGALDRLEPLTEVAKTCDFVIYGGDFAKFGDIETGKPFLERFSKIHDRIFAVSGNCDDPFFKEDLDDYDISIEGLVSYFSGLMLSGSGGGSKFTGTTPNERTDEELVSDLRMVEDSAADESALGDGAWDNLVIVTHNPPANTKLDTISNGMHVGSPGIRAFIEKYRPLLAVSGHIHESAAIDAIGPTTLVNPGPLAEGKYAIAILSGGARVPFKVESVTLQSL